MMLTVVKQVLASVFLSTLLLISACSSQSSEQPSNTGMGAAFGAAAGAVLGAASGDNSAERRRNAVIGGVIGTVAGGTIGNYMDRQEKEMRAKLQSSGVEVERNQNQINLIMPGDITFNTASSDVQPQFYGTLNAVSEALQNYPDTTIFVIGHTDNQGGFEYNQALSERRANAVATYLANTGVDHRRFRTAGRSFNMPKASNDTPAGRSMNRRVEITVVHNDELVTAQNNTQR